MNKLFGIVIASMAITVVSVATSIVTTIRANRIVRKLDKSIGDVKDMSEEKITENVIRKAVAVAADSKVDRYIRDTSDQVLMSASRSLKEEARRAVESYADETRDQVSEKISQQVADLDIEQLKRRVCDQAEKHVLKKLDGCLDSSAKKFQEQLDSAKKVYDRILKITEEKEDEEKNNTIHVTLF